MSGKGILQLKVMGDAAHLEKTLKGVVGAVAGLAVFKQVADYMVDAGKAAAEEDQQMQQLSKALKDNAGVTKEQYAEVEKWIAATQKASATADGELRPALLKLSSTTKDVGQAQDILTTALDISKARGLDLNTVVIALEKGYQGNVGGLQRLGIATKDAEGNTLSFEQVMKNANETYGGAAQEAANTTAGRMENLSLTLADLKETVGMALLPVIEKFTGFIMDNMPTIEKVMVGFADLVGAALNVLSELVFPILQTVFEAFTGSVEGKIPGTNKLFDSLGVVADALKGVFSVVMPAIQQLIKAVIDFFAGPTGQALMKGLMEALGAALDVLKSVFERVWPIIMSAIKKVVDWFNGPTGQKLMKTLFEGISAALNILQGVFEAVWPAAEAALKAAWAVMKPILDAAFWAIQKVIDAFEKWMSLSSGPNSSGGYDVMGGKDNGGFTIQNKGSGASRQIPEYALGGDVDETGIALVHRGEHVLTQGDTSLMKELIAAVKSGGMGSGGVTVQINGMPNDTAETLSNRVLFDLARVGAI